MIKFRSKDTKQMKRDRVKRKFNANHHLRNKSSVCVFRSNKNIYASYIDANGVCLQTITVTNSGNIAQAKKVGEKMGQWIKSKMKDQKSVVFNRNGFLYHGRVKAVADGITEYGILI